MAGNWGINAVLGLMACLLTFAFSFQNNTWQTSLLRAGIGFLLFFVIGYVLRFVLQQIAIKKSPNTKEQPNLDIQKSSGQKPEIQFDQTGTEPEFQAIPLTSLHNGTDEMATESIVNTINTWTKQNKEG